MLDVRRLRVLRAVVESGSVTAAAQRLNFTPSAVSQHIATLEREAGTALLEKAGRGIRPTAAGRLLAEEAAGVLARLAEAEAALHALRDGQTGTLTMTAFATAGASLLPAAVRELRAARPELRLDLAVADEPEALDAVRAGQTDLALVVATASADADADGDLLWVHVLDDPFRVVLPKRHRLAARRSIDLADLADEGWVAASSSSSICQQQAFDACLAAGFTPRFAVEADDYLAAQAYVALELGIALIPMLALGAVRDGVVVRRVRGAEPVRHVYAVTRPAIADDGPVAAMLAALRAAAAEQRRVVRS